MTDDLDTLRPEIRDAVDSLDKSEGIDFAWLAVRAELLRLQSAESRANEWQLRAEAAEAELAESRETIKRLNRRVQVAEAGVAEKVKASGGSLGRALANAAADRYMRERDEAQAELAALKARRDGSRHAFLGPDMDRITFLAEDIGPVGEYALVKVEE